MGCILVTGFEPFGGEKINPSWLAAEERRAVEAGRPRGTPLLQEEIGASARLLCRQLEQLRPWLQQIQERAETVRKSISSMDKCLEVYKEQRPGLLAGKKKKEEYLEPMQKKKIIIKKTEKKN